MPLKPQPDFSLIPVADVESKLTSVLMANGFSADRAKACAEVFASNSADGIYSHGVNRFAKFVGSIKNGSILPDREAVCVSATGSIEQWDGQLGAGPLNAVQCTDRAMMLASRHGIGCVGLANTNHWLRGGTYGQRAARKGFVFIGWSNTIANMPAWGAVNGKLGNNPLVIGVPYRNEAIVLDMAMSQYSYGALEVAGMKGEKLSVPGGYDEKGSITDDPEKILKSQRVLPIGHWKGAGLALLLDILATMLSGGLSTAEISKQPPEKNLSQVFIAFDVTRLQNFKTLASIVDQIILDYQQSVPEAGKKIRYPGEQIVKTRTENRRLGIPVSNTVWEEIKNL